MFEEIFYYYVLIYCYYNFYHNLFITFFITLIITFHNFFITFPIFFHHHVLIYLHYHYVKTKYILSQEATDFLLTLIGTLQSRIWLWISCQETVRTAGNSDWTNWSSALFDSASTSSLLKMSLPALLDGGWKRGTWGDCC